MADQILRVPVVVPYPLDSPNHLKLGDFVYYHRRHAGEWVASPAIVVVIHETAEGYPHLNVWVISHPMHHEASTTFYRPNLRYMEQGSRPDDGGHYWSFR
jgi:hypothetical protein